MTTHSTKYLVSAPDCIVLSTYEAHITEELQHELANKPEFKEYFKQRDCRSMLEAIDGWKNYANAHTDVPRLMQLLSTRPAVTRIVRIHKTAERTCDRMKGLTTVITMFVSAWIRRAAFAAEYHIWIANMLAQPNNRNPILQHRLIECSHIRKR